VDLDGVDAGRVHQEAMAQGIECMPLAAYGTGAWPDANALLLGFGAVSPAALRGGVSRLARIVDSLRRASR
jgi:DNA-binding transcriptional MocR family regulator